MKNKKIDWLSFLVGYSWSSHYFSFRKHHVFIKTTEMYAQKNPLQELSHEINVHIHLNNYI